MDKVEDELPLLRGAIILAITGHGFETPDKKFRFDPIVSLLHGEDVWSTVFVFKLDTRQEIFRHLNPEDGIQTGLRTVFLEKKGDFFHVRGRDFINQIGPHRSPPSPRLSICFAIQNASMIE
jgi:hypothetical protein